MDEKTEELRDIFVDVAGDGTVTESQEESPGSIRTDEEGVDERIAAVIERMRDRFGFATDLDDAALVAVVRAFYDDEDDGSVAAELGVPVDDVRRARLDLHLFRDGDVDAPFDLTPVREAERRASGEAAEDRPANGDPPDDVVADLAAELDADAGEVRRYYRVVAAQREARQVSQRFQSEFEEALADAGLSTMTDAMPENGRSDTTEDIGSLEEDADVSF